MIRLLGFTGVDLWFAGIIIANTAGLATIPAFQMTAENYLNKSEASLSTILYFLLPPVFVFTTVSYTEPVFLLFSILAWYTHEKGNDFGAAILASFAALTRVYGLLIVVPLAYDLRHSKRVAFLMIPLAVFVGWLSYAYLRVGNALAPFDAQSFWRAPIEAQFLDSVNRFFSTGDLRLFQYLTHFWFFAVLGVTSLSFVTWLCIRSSRLDRTLGVYSFTFLFSILSAVIAFIPTLVSMPRFLSFIFPVGFSLRTQRKLLVIVSLIALAFVDFAAWWMFLFTTVFH
jgi:hypothetical protein